MGRRLFLLACAALVATVGVSFIVDGLSNSDQARFLIGAVLILAAVAWSAAASRSRQE